MADTFIFRKEWIDNIDELDLLTQDRILGDLARYGAGLPLQHESDPVVATIVETQKKRIDASIAAYGEKMQMSQNAGRKGSVDKSQIYELGLLGMKAREIAEMVGCSLSTIQHSEEWKRAKEELKIQSLPGPKPKTDSKKLTVFDF